MGVVISFLNEKGGVGKTTTVLEFASILGMKGKKILMIDLDGQANLTQTLLAHEPEHTIADILLDDENELSVIDILYPARESWKNCVIIPSEPKLSIAEKLISEKINREMILKRIIDEVKDSFDFILLDLPPALNLVTLNALVTSDYYIIPTDLSEYSITGIRNVEEMVLKVKQSGLNKNILSLGILVTSFQKGISKSVRSFLQELSESFPRNYFQEIKIPHSTKVLDSQRSKIPLSSMLKEHPVSVAYNKAVDKTFEVIN